MPDRNLQLPGNPRYQPEVLKPDFGYDNLYQTVAEVEIATLQTLGEIGVISQADIASLTPAVVQELLLIPTTTVDKIERTVTKHDIRAWVQLAQSKVSPGLKRWIHVPLTSYDVIDTGRMLQFVRGHAIVKKLADKAIKDLAERTTRYASELQIGRTHGQHALPITVGFWFATILNRFLANTVDANESAGKLVGKISGAVGAYNAQFGLGIADKCGDTSFEMRVLKKLGLRAAPISTQILAPEPLAKYLFDCFILSATIDQFGRDGRHLMRTEIGEIGEPFEVGNVGSSTMAQKRNPITFEGFEGMFTKNVGEIVKVLLTLTSEHQRDLTASAVMRDFPIIIVNLVQQLVTLVRESEGKTFISRITVNEEACRRNFGLSGDLILAEPLYIALQMAGYPGDAHKLISDQAIPLMRRVPQSLVAATRTMMIGELDAAEADRIWSNIPPETLRLLQKPELYTGNARGKALEVAEAARQYLQSQAQ